MIDVVATARPIVLVLPKRQTIPARSAGMQPTLSGALSVGCGFVMIIFSNHSTLVEENVKFYQCRMPG